MRYEISFDTLEDIDNSGFNVYVENAYISHLSMSNDSVVQRIRKKVVVIQNIEDCERMLRNTGRVLCLTTGVYARQMVQRNSHIGGVARIKIAKPILWYEPLVYFFEKQSPIVEKFVEILHRIVEASKVEMLVNEPQADGNNSNTSMMYEEPPSVPMHEEQQSALLIQIIAVTSVGYLISLVVFIKECITGHLFFK